MFDVLLDFLANHASELAVLTATVWLIVKCGPWSSKERDPWEDYEDNDQKTREQLEASVVNYTSDPSNAEDEEFKTDIDGQILPVFDDACTLSKQITIGGNESRLQLYGLYKQGSEGDCDKVEPRQIDMVAHAKWGAWIEYKGMTCATAMHKYIWTVRELARLQDSGAAEFIKEAQSTAGSTMGPVSSQFFKMPDEAEVTLDEVFQWAEANDQNKLDAAIKANPNIVNKQDEQGQTVLHWAADRGHMELITFLLERGANVNATDTMGETPLFAAVANGKLDVTKQLLENGADKAVKNVDGETIADVADTADMKAMLAGE